MENKEKLNLLEKIRKEISVLVRDELNPKTQIALLEAVIKVENLRTRYELMGKANKDE